MDKSHKIIHKWQLCKPYVTVFTRMTYNIVMDKSQWDSHKRQHAEPLVILLTDSQQPTQIRTNTMMEQIQ